MRLPAGDRALAVKRASDLEVDVDPDEVHELERPHPVAAVLPHDEVDLVVSCDPLVEDAQRLERERAVAPIDNEAGGIGAANGGAAHALRDTQRGGDGGLIGRGRRDHLHELHERRRVEEVHAADPLCVVRFGGDFRDGE